ncbi:protein NRT1/ PTR FAMILY 8.5-like [Typha angustifolia]|uniref:protein NRT1/ PTR FAMILY 8.5-like n=1 Tax=Typha angustifolia TaxID=59011 RepID=UPI003C30743C
MHISIAEASNALTNYMGTSYIVAVATAVFADMFVGRHKAVLLSASIEFLVPIPPSFSLVLYQLLFLCNILTLNRDKLTIQLFDPTSHCLGVSGKDAALLFASLYLIAIGSAGITASAPVHGADQFDEKDPWEARQMSSFFNWLLLALCIGADISSTLVVWVQNNRGCWDMGIAISTGAMLSAFATFLPGVPSIRFLWCEEIIQVFAAAFRNRKLELPTNLEELYEISREEGLVRGEEFVSRRKLFRFLDKAAIQTESSPRKLCRVTQVENAKTIVMSTCLAQLQTFSFQQDQTMNTRLAAHFHVPTASLPIIPIYDSVFFPFASRLTGIQRIGGRPRPLLRLHGHPRARLSEAQESRKPTRVTGRDARAATAPYQLILALLPVLHLWYSRHVRHRRVVRVLLLAGAEGVEIGVGFVPLVLHVAWVLLEHYTRAGGERCDDEEHEDRRLARRQQS